MAYIYPYIYFAVKVDIDEDLCINWIKQNSDDVDSILEEGVDKINQFELIDFMSFYFDKENKKLTNIYYYSEKGGSFYNFIEFCIGVSSWDRDISEVLKIMNENSELLKDEIEEWKNKFPFLIFENPISMKLFLGVN